MRPSDLSKYSRTPWTTSSRMSASAEPGRRRGASKAVYAARMAVTGCGCGSGRSWRDFVTFSQSSTRRPLRWSGMGMRIDGRWRKVSSCRSVSHTHHEKPTFRLYIVRTFSMFSQSRARLTPRGAAACAPAELRSSLARTLPNSLARPAFPRLRSIVPFVVDFFASFAARSWRADSRASLTRSLARALFSSENLRTRSSETQSSQL